MTECECCGREKPETEMFKYEKHNVCDICYTNIEEYKKYNTIHFNLSITKADIKKIQLRNEELNNKIKIIDFSVFPREFLEEFLEYFKTEEFNTFKKLYLQFRKIKSKKEDDIQI